MTLTRRSALFTPALIAAAATPVLFGSPPAFAAADDEYVTKTLEGGTFLLKTSELAQTKATGAMLKEFARLEIGEQTALGEVLKSTGATPPPLMAAHQKTLDDLQGMDGPAFDAAYLSAQVTGHNEALALQKPEAMKTDVTVPVAAAKIAAEFITTHLAVLAGIKASMS